MCGRVVQARPLDELASLYGASVDGFARAALPPRYNVAPTNPIAVLVVDDGPRRLTAHRWGLLPPAAGVDPKRGPVINARAETLAANALFRSALEHRRCVVPVDGFYEWQRIADRPQPYYIHRSDDRPLALAGIWAPWRTAPDGGVVGTCAIVTTTPDAVVGRLHDRMPVALDDEAREAWLDRSTGVEALLALVAGPGSASSDLEARQVAPWVNSVRNDGPRLIEPAPVQEPLFGAAS